jgi:hypothetical protein
MDGNRWPMFLLPVGLVGSSRKICSAAPTKTGARESGERKSEVQIPCTRIPSDPRNQELHNYYRAVPLAMLRLKLKHVCDAMDDKDKL